MSNTSNTIGSSEGYTLIFILCALRGRHPTPSPQASLVVVCRLCESDAQLDRDSNM